MSLCYGEKGDSDLPTLWPQGLESMTTTMGGCWHRGQGLFVGLGHMEMCPLHLPGSPWVSGCPQSKGYASRAHRQDGDRTWWLLWADSHVSAGQGHAHICLPPVSQPTPQMLAPSVPPVTPGLAPGHTPGSAAPRLPLEGAPLSPRGRRRDMVAELRGLSGPRQQPQNREAEPRGRETTMALGTESWGHIQPSQF